MRDDLRRQWDFSRDGVLQSIEDTLDRTGLDRLDIVHLHDPDDHWRQAAEEAMPTLAEPRAQGLIGAIGAGTNQSAMLARLLRETAADAVMQTGRYTLLDQSAPDDVLPAAEGVRYDYQEVPPALVTRARAIAEVCAAHGTTLPAAAVAFPCSRPSIINVTLGMCTAEQVARNVGLQRQHIPEGLWNDLRARGLVRSDVPAVNGPGRSARCL